MSRSGVALAWPDQSALAMGGQAGERLEAIEALRGVAALMVVVGHVLDDSAQFGVGAGVIPDWSIWNAGVDLFFVISGFIMVWTFGDRFGTPGAPREFVIRRLSRIVPLYWLATALTALLLLLWPSLFDRSAFGWQHLVLSLLFVPHLSPAGELLPMVGVGWTLNYEMYFYLVFAVGLMLPKLAGLALIVLVMMVSFVVSAMMGSDAPTFARFLANSVVLDFVLGVGLAYFLRLAGVRWQILLLASAAALAASLLLSELLGGMRFIRAGLPAVALVAALLAIYPRSPGRIGQPLVALGAASYALYLFHPLVLNLTKALMLQASSAWDLHASQLFGWYVACALLLSIAAGLLLRAVVELPLLRLWRRMVLVRR